MSDKSITINRSSQFYLGLWFVEFEALSQVVKVWGLCSKPFLRYLRLLPWHRKTVTSSYPVAI